MNARNLVSFRAIVFSSICLLLPVSGLAANLIPSDFSHRMKISTPNYLRGETLNEFPLLVKVDTLTPNFYANVAMVADGGDVRFTREDQTTILPHEIDVWNTAGESLFWVKVPELNAGTCIWMYWGNPFETVPASDTDGTVWDNDYIAVYHMNETGNTPFDSAQLPRDNSGIDRGTDASVVPNAIVGAGYNYVNKGRVGIANNGDLANLQNATISFWYLKLSQGGANKGTVFGSGNENIGIRHLESDEMFLRIDGGDVIATPPLPDDFFTWHHITFTYDGPGQTVKLYMNGELNRQELTPFPWYTPGNLVGHLGTDEQAPNGVLDEMRASGVTRGSNWMHATYLNMASNRFFNLFGASETPSSADPVVSTQPAILITSNSATINGTLIWTGAAPTEVFAYLGTNDGGTIKANWDQIVPFGVNLAATPVSYATNLTALPADTRYFVSFYASNAVNEHWGGVMAFATLGPPRVDNLGVSEQISGNARLNGTFLSPSRGAVQFYWGTSDGGTNKADWDNLVDLGQQDTESFDAAILDLLFGAEYYYRTYATNALGDDWADATFMFLPSEPPGLAVENRDASNISSNGAVANGTLFGAGGIFDVHFYYGLTDGTTNAAAWSNTVFIGSFTNQNVPNLSYDLTGLIPGTNYAYTFRAVNARTDLWGNPSTIFSPGLRVLDYTHVTLMQFCGYNRNETLSNFPVLVAIDTSIPGFNYADFAAPNGGDLRFMDEAQTTFLNYEIDVWNPGGTSYVWVQVPDLVDSNSAIWALWGNSVETNFPGYTTDGSTWSEGYIGVWHLSETVGMHEDSSVNRHHTDFQTGDLDQDVPGVVDGGTEFLDQNNNWFETYDRPSLDRGYNQLTLEAWVYDTGNDPTPHNGILSKRVTWGSGESYYILLWNGRFVYFNIGGDRDRGNTSLPPNEWHHVTGTFDGRLNTDRIRMYYDGELDATHQDVNTTIPDQNSDLHLGILNNDYGAAWQGSLDEVRISSIARSSNWMWATWFNMASNTDFVCYNQVQLTAEIDLQVTKTPSQADWLYGTNLTYTIRVRNNSASDAGRLWVTDSLPAAVSFLGSTPPPNSQAGQDYVFEFTQLVAGATATITMDVSYSGTSSIPTAVTNWVVAVGLSNETLTVNNQAFSVTTIPDSDGDGILNPNDPDDDNDRFLDANEAIANTDPVDPLSLLWVRILNTSDQLVRGLGFPASTGRTYRIEATTNLFSGIWTPVQTNIPGTNGWINRLDTNGEPRVYYRIGVESP